jgi:hypothetical protein
VAAEKATVVQLMSARLSMTARSSATKLSAVGSPLMPSRLGSCPAATVSPTPTLMPVKVASEMLSISTPRRSARAISRITPTSRVRVARARDGSSLPAATPAASRVEPVRMATVEVVLTDRVRDPPSNGYTAMQVYSPTCAGRSARVAYAIACGMTTAPAASPPMRSLTSQARS